MIASAAERVTPSSAPSACEGGYAWRAARVRPATRLRRRIHIGTRLRPHSSGFLGW